jgi:hypothetical protein
MAPRKLLILPQGACVGAGRCHGAIRVAMAVADKNKKRRLPEESA